MALFEEIIKFLVSDILVGINIVIILSIILHFIKKSVLPQIPHWIKQYKKEMMELQAIQRAKNNNIYK